MIKYKKLYLLLILPAFIIIFLTMCPIVNDNTAASVAHTIWETPLPPKTIKLEKISMAGKLVGNGNGMQFFGAMLIKSDFSLDELSTYYSKYSQNEWSYIVKRQTSKEILEIENDRLLFETDFDNNNYFIIYTWGEGIPLFYEFDLRGH